MMKMNDDDLFNMRSEIEKRFEEVLQKGEDVRLYLYYPHSLLSDKIRKHLDNFLLDEAYRMLTDDKFSMEKFVIYKDSLVTVKLDEKSQRIELLERLISYFLPKEEYEKCSFIQHILNKVKQ